MSQNKRKEHANHYYDPRVLENYCRNDILLTFELAGRQAGRLIAKGEASTKIIIFPSNRSAAALSGLSVN